MTRPGMMPKFRYIAVLLFMALVLPQFAGAALNSQPMLPVQAKFGSIPLLPYLDYYLDESGSMDIEEIASPELSDSFSAFSMEKLPAATGVLWLRFTLAPISPPERAPVLVLDIGPCTPGVPMLYEPEKNELSGALEWRETYPGNRNIMLLPEAGQEPVPCYLRLDGLPGLWFGPTVRTPGDAASNWGSLARPGAVLALGVVMFLCLLRGLSERGQWRIWTALYVFFALLQAFAGLPPQIGNPGLPGLCAILAPGIALMLLPHVGRHLLRTRQNSRPLDIQFLLLSLPGAACALAPLVPGWNWLDRWLELWPLAMLIFVPSALAAWLMGLAGSRRFLLACLLPPIFTGAGILGLYFGIPSNLLASAPLWGVALSALLLAATRAPHYGDDARENEEKNVPNAPAGNGEIINLETPLDDSGLKLVSEWPGPGRGGLTLPNLGPAMRTDADAAALEDPNLRLIPGESTQADEDVADGPPTRPGRFKLDDEREKALRAQLDDIMREGAALGNCSLPPAARKSAENMLGAASTMAEIVSGAPIGADKVSRQSLVNFNLQHLLRDAHDAVAPTAENAGIGLGWYMPPALPQLYRGVCGNLGEILRMLLESSVRATTSGSVHLSARHVPESPDPGHILFTITDSGSGFPPAKRSSLALDRAWELVGAHNGNINMECGSQGTTITFSLHFTPLEDEEEVAPALPRVAVLCENSDMRREIAHMLAPLDVRIGESATPDELLRRQNEDAAGVLIVAGRMAAPAASDMLREFVALAREAGYGTCKILAVHSDNSQDRLLAASGFTHAIPEPLDTAELRSTVLDLVEYVSADYAPPSKDESQEHTAAQDIREPESPSPDWRKAPEPAAPEKFPDWLETSPRPRAPVNVDRPPLPDEIWQEADEPSRPISGEDESGAAPGSQNGEKSGPEPNAGLEPEVPPATASAPPSETSTIIVEPPIEESGSSEGGQARAEEAFAATDLPDEAKAPDEDAPVSGKARETARPESPAAESEKLPPENKIEDPAAIAMPPAEDLPVRAGKEAASLEEEQKAPVTGAASQSGDKAQTLEPQAVEETRATAPNGRSESRTRQEPVAAVRDAEHGEKPVIKLAKERESSARSYVSPWIGGSGEWVGEPVPIVKKSEAENPPLAASGQAVKMAGIEKTQAKPESSPLDKEPAARPRLNQPPVDQVEWVGEPMPIQPEKRGRAPENASGSQQDGKNVIRSPLAREANNPGQGRESTSREADRQPVAPLRTRNSQTPASENASSRQESNNLIADFMSKTISQVSSTLERLTRGGKVEEKPAKAASAPQNPPAADRGAGRKEEPAPEPARQESGIDPTILRLVGELDLAIADAQRAFAMRNCQAVADCARRISEESDNFGLRVLSRMAMCVVRAGRHGDMQAVGDLLPDLVAAVERNKITLTQMK